MNEPNVLLLDEPLGALDLKLRKRLQVELKRIQMDVGITFVYVTHDQEEALTMSDRIAVMHRGRIEQVGAPEDLYDRPATSFVADFIGTTNLLSRHGRGAWDRTSRSSASTPATSASCASAAGGPGRPSSSASDRSRSTHRRGAGRHRTVQPRTARHASSRWRTLAPRFSITFARMEASPCRFSQAERVSDSNPEIPCEMSWAPADALVLGDRPAEMEESA